jgi:hypothetical protein
MLRALAMIAVLMLVGTACGGDGGGSTTNAPSTTADTTAAPGTTTGAGATTTAAPAPSGGTPAAGHPLVIAAIDFEAGSILIRNDGAEDYDMSGHWLCNRPNYTAFPAEVLQPGRIVEIDTASLGIGAGNGELGVYTSNSFGDPTAIIRYVEWGDSGHGRSDTAVDGGVWVDGDFVDNGGANIQSSGSDPTSSADWSTT